MSSILMEMFLVSKICKEFFAFYFLELHHKDWDELLNDIMRTVKTVDTRTSTKQARRVYTNVVWLPEH
jgi:hypothetical protein